MGRQCTICDRERANEKFGGKGYAASVCRDCRQRPKAEQTLTLATNEVWGFLKQTNISARNIARLESLSSIKDAAFQKFRRLVLEIARVRPRKRQRWKNVRREYPDLYRKVVAAGWFSEYHLDERLDHPELPRDVEEADWDALDPDERQGILAHSRHDSTCDSSLAE